MSVDKDGLERRVAMLEQQHVELKAALEAVAQNQLHSRELFDLKFKVLESGMTALLTKAEALSIQIGQMTSDVSGSPMGRAIGVRLAELDEKTVTHARRLTKIDADINQFVGALTFAKQSGIGSLVLGGGALLVVILKALRVLP